jgi:hypothetical protein
MTRKLFRIAEIPCLKLFALYHTNHKTTKVADCRSQETLGKVPNTFDTEGE